MINFTSEEIIKNSVHKHWSLNEDLKLLNKLRSLDELLSTKSKEILDNVNKTEDKVSSELILVKNLINDFYLVGHKQFVENRVEEENDSKLFNEQNKSVLENEESFKLKSVDQDTLIHEQMKSILDSSLLFIREKLKDLNEDDQSNDIDTDQKLEKLIKNHRYNQEKVPPIINSERFKTEIFDLVKQSSTSRTNLNKSKSKIEDSIETKSTTTETSSIISDLENSLVNEQILEINENKFIEKLNANLNIQSNTTKHQAPIYSTSDEQNRKEVDSNKLVKESKNLQNSTLKSPNLLDESQINRSALRNDLDAIFGKSEILRKSSGAKNRIFDDEDSDDELFLPTSTAQPQKLAESTKEKLFKVDKFSPNESIDETKKIEKPESKDLFNSNVKSSDTKKKAIDKLFESDSDDDDNIFSTRLPAKKSLTFKDDKPTIKSDEKIENKSVMKSEELANEVNKIDLDKSDTDSAKETSSGQEILPKQDKTEEKMSSKKELFKNQLENLFSKKRDINKGFIKVNRNEEADEEVNDLLGDENKKTEEEKTTTKLSTSSLSPILSPINKQRKEFDLFSSKPSDDPFLAEDLNFKTSTLDNNLVKSRVKFTNRKKPSKQSAKINNDLNRVQVNTPSTDIQQKSNFSEEIKSEQVAKDKEITKNKEVTKVIEPTILLKTETIKQIKESKETSSKSPTTSTMKKTLFTDSEEDDFEKDFKFDKKINEKKSLSETLDKKFKKLFEDSDEDDLLFKSSSKEPLNSKLTPEKTEPKTEVKDLKKKALTLFDDSDSDDELFKS